LTGKRRDLESPIQAAIVEFVRAGYPSALLFSVPNGGGKLAKATAAKLKWTGLYAGIPDLIITWPGDWGLIEVKSPDGVLSPEQRDAHALLRGQGHKVAVVRSVDDTENILALWGVPTRIIQRLAA